VCSEVEPVRVEENVSEAVLLIVNAWNDKEPCWSVSYKALVNLSASKIIACVLFF